MRACTFGLVVAGAVAAFVFVIFVFVVVVVCRVVVVVVIGWWVVVVVVGVVDLAAGRGLQPYRKFKPFRFHFRQQIVCF